MGFLVDCDGGPTVRTLVVQTATHVEPFLCQGWERILRVSKPRGAVSRAYIAGNDDEQPCTLHGVDSGE